MSEIAKAYTDRRRKSAFSGLPHFMQLSKYKNKAQVEKELAAVDAYTLHRPVKKKFQKRITKVFFRDHQWGIDLMDVQNMSKDNGGIKYILIAIDNFSRLLRSAFLKSKDGPTVLKGLKKIIREAKVTPKYILCDQGKEFLNKDMNAFLQSKGIKLFSVHSVQKSAMAERSIRTLRDKLARWQTFSKSKDFVKVWPRLVSTFNSSVNRTTGFAPNDINAETEADAWNNIYSKYVGQIPKKSKFKVGDTIRISRSKLTFDKSSVQSYTSEIFKIKKVVLSVPTNYYYLEDMSGEEIIGELVL
jgi:Integrase core domain